MHHCLHPYYWCLLVIAVEKKELLQLHLLEELESTKHKYRKKTIVDISIYSSSLNCKVLTTWYKVRNKQKTIFVFIYISKLLKVILDKKNDANHLVQGEKEAENDFCIYLHLKIVKSDF